MQIISKESSVKLKVFLSPYSSVLVKLKVFRGEGVDFKPKLRTQKIHFRVANEPLLHNMVTAFVGLLEC